VIDREAVAAAVDQLKTDGVEVTWKVEHLAAPGTERTDEHLFVHVVDSKFDGLQTYEAITGALRPVVGTRVQVN
jgi:hypothetical protein